EMTHILNENGHDIYIKMVPYSATLEETTSKTAKASKKFHVCYEIAVFNVADTTCKIAEPASIDAIVKTKSRTNKVFGVHTCNPKEFVEDLVYTRMVNTSPSSSSTFDANLKAFYNNYDLYDAICHKSEEWQANAAKTVSDYLDSFAPSQHKANIYSVIEIVQQLETYNIPLNLYRDIYHRLAAEYNDTELTEICKHNLNLLMSNTLDHLNTVKNTLTSLLVPQVEPAIDPMYSKEQAAAITTKEPLALVQSVAGSGKSSVILARIKYMVESGIDPNDITVLSFTNAAANHISDLNPDVHSMTIAKMIHTIYTNNFDKHQLSSIDTIINSLDIYMPDDQFAYEFKKRLRSTAKADRDAFTTLNNFIEENYDEVMNTLDIIGQTSLELEIIICYQKIDTLAEPPEVKSKYLIIDEVQDNSIFEFIYTLKYVDKNKESLFIVGRLALPTLNPTNCGKPTLTNMIPLYFGKPSYNK
ncbi:MAG: AAA family ATPase, partial [Campylobacter concisus]|nr:AAA family ATPase [Campylobacter concisus]